MKFYSLTFLYLFIFWTHFYVRVNANREDIYDTIHLLRHKKKLIFKIWVAESETVSWKKSHEVTERKTTTDVEESESKGRFLPSFSHLKLCMRFSSHTAPML